MDPLEKDSKEYMDMLYVVPEGCDDISVFTQGKRGIIMKAVRNGETVAIKVPRPSSEANNTPRLEGTYLEKVNKVGIGPKLIDVTDEYVMMKFIEGKLVGEFLQDETVSKENVQAMLRHVFSQLFTLDKIGINKFELTNPYKHIIVQDDMNIVMVDFERARFATRPKNVSQFVEYLNSANIKPLLQQKGILMKEEEFKKAIKEYQHSRELFDIRDY